MEARVLGAYPKEGTGECAAYRQLAQICAARSTTGGTRRGRRLPTEAELIASTGLGRQTVRRAFQELAAEGAIYRVPGRGTFAMPGDGRYLRSFGSIDDLMALSIDTELQVVEPLHVLASVAIAERLEPGADTVMAISFLRLRADVPFCYTQVYLPMRIGRRLRDLPEVTALAEPGGRASFTLISLMDRVSERPIYSAVQNCHRGGRGRRHRAPARLRPGPAGLRIDRLYRDRELTPLEYAVSHFHPDRYSYRIQLRAQLDHATP